MYYIESFKFGIMASIMGWGTSHSLAKRGQREDTSAIRSIISVASFILLCLANSKRSWRVMSSNFPFIDIWCFAVHPPFGYPSLTHRH